MSSTRVAHSTPFRCPSCRTLLRLVENACSQCGWRARGEPEGVLSFVTDPALRAESDHYDGEYAGAGLTPPVELEALGGLWRDNPWAPFNETLLDAMGDLRGKTVLVLGNGVATKELYFLTQRPRTLVCSDLSAAAMRRVRDHYPDLVERDDVFFAAIDGQELPFADGSVSVVYGYAFVHHLPDLDRFLAEVARVLEPGGRAVFMDSSYSPLWQAAKHGPLNRLMHLGHTVQPISDEDQRYTLAGGFRSGDMACRAAEVGLEAWFRPTGTIHYLAARLSQIFGPQLDIARLDRRTWALQPDGRHVLVIGYRRILSALVRLDSWLEQFPLARRNRMRLVWGINKPPET